MYKKVELPQGFVGMEKEIANLWNARNVIKKNFDMNQDGEYFTFYDGPPTANGKPHIGHILTRVMKDIIPRYKVMKGYKVIRKAGWDTHGLPVELEIEKKLGISGKEQIEEYGVEKFVKECKESVFTYVSMWEKMTEQIGYWVDMENPYVTYHNPYIESVWWALKQMWDKGLLYEGHKVMPYCPRCGTALSSHEVAQGYKDVKDLTAVAKFKVADEDNKYILAWTTTPWTLPSNLALCINKAYTYIEAKVNDEILILAKDLAPKVLGEDFELVREFPGTELLGTKYEQLMPFGKVEGKAFEVIHGDYVTLSDGTGVVHIAPAYGEDDSLVAKANGITFINLVDKEGKFVEEVTPWAGKFVKKCDESICKWLEENNKLFKAEKHLHSYPHCWRCGTPLVYYANPSWYIEMTKLRDQLVANNNTVNWYPKFVGEGRFGNWLENVKDWAVSRTRYWGTPLNVWRCECGHTDSVGSRAELAEKAIENIDPATVELHRPYVDDIHITCSECGKPMTRVKEVIDCWFDSGAMPFAQHHYPFENKEKFERLFPADYICEGIDQTRGWFYSLLAISTFVMGKAPYKNVLVNDLVLDKNGKKMSKSKGNTVDPFELFDKYGADALRWYLLYVSPPWTPTRFDVDGLKEVQSKFLGTMKNVYNFFTLYANTDEVNPKDFFVDYKNRPELDRWILSKFNNLKKEVEENLEIFELNKTVRMIQDFINEDLSNWYIRRSRRRFWATELTEDKKSVYNTTYEILTELCQLIAPFAPYISEEIYRNLTGEVSVHLSNYPKANLELINPELEEKMDLVKNLVTLGRASREATRIKVRQPIQKVLVDGKFKDTISDVVDLIKEELNVKEVVFAKDLGEYMNFSLKPNFKVLGPVLGAKMKFFAGALNKLNSNEVAPKLEVGETLTVDIDGENFEFNKDHVLVNISAKEGFNVSMENNLFVILDTTLTTELIEEGYAREFISKIQQIRKASNFDVLDNIDIDFCGDDEIAQAVENFKDYIKSETLALEINRVDDESLEKHNLNDHMTGIKVTRK